MVDTRSSFFPGPPIILFWFALLEVNKERILKMVLMFWFAKLIFLAMFEFKFEKALGNPKITPLCFFSLPYSALERSVFLLIVWCFIYSVFQFCSDNSSRRLILPCKMFCISRKLSHLTSLFLFHFYFEGYCYLTVN